MRQIAATGRNPDATKSQDFRQPSLFRAYYFTRRRISDAPVGGARRTR